MAETSRQANFGNLADTTESDAVTQQHTKKGAATAEEMMERLKLASANTIVESTREAYEQCALRYDFYSAY